jgi:LPXTG-motif cell wall-anchored protein
MRFFTAALTASTTAALLVGAGPAHAQSAEAVIVVDVMVVNDDGGTLDGTTVVFEHPALGGGVATGSDNNVDLKCLTTDGSECYITSIPTGPGELTVTPVDGYTVTVDCSIPEPLVTIAEISDLNGDIVEAGTALGTASGSTWDVDTFEEVFCTVMLDDNPETTTTTAAPTTTTTTTSTTTTSTTIAPTTAAPTVPPPPPVPAPDTVLPETGTSQSTWIALIGALALALGLGTVRLARR